MTEKQRELLLKIAELAKNGVDGEKINAQAVLNKMLRKFNISLNELETDNLKEHRFAYQKQFEWLFFQIFAKIKGKNAEIWTLRNKTIVYAMCTDSEKIEIETKYLFFKDRFKMDFAIFKKAFIYRNDLAVMSNEEKKFTDKEREAQMRAYSMSQSMERHSYLKMIEEKK